MRVLLGFGVLMTFIDLVSSVTSTISFDPDAMSAINDVKQGSDGYATCEIVNSNSLKLVTKGRGFSNMVSDLDAAKADARCRYAFYMSSDGSGQKIIIFVVWNPSSANPTVKKLYKSKAEEVSAAIGGASLDLITVTTGSNDDLVEKNIAESYRAGYSSIDSNEYYYDVQDVVTTKDKVTIDDNVINAYDKVKQGLASFCIIDISSALTDLTLETLGAAGATFADMVTALEASSGAKLIIIVLPVNIGGLMTKKIFLIVWIPADVSDKERVKMRAVVPQLKAALKNPDWTEVSTSTSRDLNMKNLVAMVGGKVDTPSGPVVFKLDAAAMAALSDLAKVVIRFATFSFIPDRSSVTVDKIGSRNADFNGLIDEFVKVQNNGDARFACYMAPIKIDGQIVNKLIAFLWIPFNVPTNLRLLYESNFNNFKVLLKQEVFFAITVNTVGQMNLDPPLKAILGAKYEGTGSLGGKVIGEGSSTDAPEVKFDMNGVNGVKKMQQGQIRFLIFRLATVQGQRQTQAVLEKAAPSSASFDNLKTDLFAAQESGMPKMAMFLAPVNVRGKLENKIIVIVWVPLKVSASIRSFYTQSVGKFIAALAALDVTVWSTFTGITMADLDLSGLIKTGVKTSLLKVSLGSLSLDLGTDVLGALGGIVGTAGNLISNVVGGVLGLGTGILGGLLGGITNILGGLLGGLLGGKGGLLGGLVGGLLGGGDKGGGLLGGILGGGDKGGGLVGGLLGGGESGGGLVGGLLGGGESGGGLVGGLLGGGESGGGLVGGLLGGGNKGSSSGKGGGLLGGLLG